MNVSNRDVADHRTLSFLPRYDSSPTQITSSLINQPFLAQVSQQLANCDNWTTELAMELLDPNDVEVSSQFLAKVMGRLSFRLHKTDYRLKELEHSNRWLRE